MSTKGHSCFSSSVIRNLTVVFRYTGTPNQSSEHRSRKSNQILQNSASYVNWQAQYANDNLFIQFGIKIIINMSNYSKVSSYHYFHVIWQQSSPCILISVFSVQWKRFHSGMWVTITRCPINPLHSRFFK